MFFEFDLGLLRIVTYVLFLSVSRPVKQNVHQLRWETSKTSWRLGCSQRLAGHVGPNQLGTSFENA